MTEYVAGWHGELIYPKEQTVDVIAFCENGSCVIILYKTAKPIREGATHAITNCPGCGQFGRLKNEVPKGRPIQDNPQA